MKKGKAVLVTTECRGVFFGYLDKLLDDTIFLDNARNCIYWSSDVKGFLGLAVYGPSESCKIGPKVKKIQLNKVTSVTEVATDAARKWEIAPWK